MRPQSKQTTSVGNTIAADLFSSLGRWTLTSAPYSVTLRPKRTSLPKAKNVSVE